MNDGLIERISVYRSKTYRTLPANRLKSKQAAVSYVNERGAILFHPSKDIDMPSLWVATAGDRPVPNEHDDPGQISWQWKDELLSERQCYYGRLIGQKMSFLSFSLLPYFFRLAMNIDFEHDYLYLYEKGEMSFEAKQVYEVLLHEGPMDTLLLRKKAGLWGKENQYRYTKTLNWLQMEMMLIPIGIANVGRWNYAFIFDILPRYYPDLPDLSLANGRKKSRREIIKSITLSLGSTDIGNLQRLLRWKSGDIKATVHQLEEEAFLVQAANEKVDSRPQLILSDLLL